MSLHYLPTLFLLLFAGMLQTTHIHASNAVSPAEMRANLVQKAAQRLNMSTDRVEKMITGKKVKRRMQRLVKESPFEIDFTDPVHKWLWFGLFGLGAAIVLSIFSLGLGGLVAFLAVVCLVIWLVKQSGAV